MSGYEELARLGGSRSILIAYLLLGFGVGVYVWGFFVCFYVCLWAQQQKCFRGGP